MKYIWNLERLASIWFILHELASSIRFLTEQMIYLDRELRIIVCYCRNRIIVCVLKKCAILNRPVSFMKILNITGRRIDPLGTPFWMALHLLCTPDNFTYCYDQTYNWWTVWLILMACHRHAAWLWLNNVVNNQMLSINRLVKVQQIWNLNCFTPIFSNIK